jgi:hypothetical protein
MSQRSETARETTLAKFTDGMTDEQIAELRTDRKAALAEARAMAPKRGPPQRTLCRNPLVCRHACTRAHPWQSSEYLQNVQIVDKGDEFTQGISDYGQR